MAHRVVIRAVSDLHGHLPDVPACDLLLIAGDICPLTDGRAAVQAAWLDGPCRAWLQGLPVGHVVVVAGNHDFVFEQPERVPPLPWTYLQDRLVTVGGLRVYGTPWTPIAGHWAFQATAEELAQRLASMPTGLDVLVSHFPPRGFGDCVRPRDYSLLSGCPPEVHIGSDALLGVIDRGGPGLVVYGHRATRAWRSNLTSTIEHGGCAVADRRRHCVRRARWSGLSRPVRTPCRSRSLRSIGGRLRRRR